MELIGYYNDSPEANKIVINTNVQILSISKQILYPQMMKVSDNLKAYLYYLKNSKTSFPNINYTWIYPSVNLLILAKLYMAQKIIRLDYKNNVQQSRQDFPPTK